MPKIYTQVCNRRETYHAVSRPAPELWRAQRHQLVLQVLLFVGPQTVKLAGLEVGL